MRVAPLGLMWRRNVSAMLSRAVQKKLFVFMRFPSLRIGLLPKSSTEIFHAAIANRHGDGFARKFAAQQLQRPGDVRSRGESAEDAFLPRQPLRDLCGPGIGDRNESINLLPPDESQI